VALHDPVLALDFDLAATVRLLDSERRALNEAVNHEDSPPVCGNTGEVHW
jgi:hypothetical protein